MRIIGKKVLGQKGQNNLFLIAIKEYYAEKKLLCDARYLFEQKKLLFSI